MKPKLLIITGSATKFLELSQGLSEFFDCEQKELHEPEIQGTPEQILIHKLHRAYEAFKQPVLVDDTSGHLEALNGFPGQYIKYLWDYMTPYEVGVKFAGSRLKGICRLAICFEPGNIVTSEGVVEGEIIKPKDDNHKNGFWDLFFVADGTDKPMIELSLEEKNEISHRGQAMKNLLAKLASEKRN